MSADLDGEHAVFPESVELSVSNVGGIDQTTVPLRAGVTVLSGRNATNRTSLLQGLMAALGSRRASLKADASHGTATLDADQTYTAHLERVGNTVDYGGDPYLTDPELADLFAFLLESNEARRAVARSEDLRALIMRPVDTAAIREEISQLEAEKRDLDDQLDDLTALESRRPKLQAEQTRLDETIEELRAELQTLRAAIERADDQQPDQEGLSSKLDTLATTRTELDRVRDRLDTERESLDALHEERDSLQAELADLDDERGTEQLASDIESLRAQTTTLGEEISRLQQTIQFNQTRLDEEESVIPAAGDPTAELLSGGGEVTCWTCGSTVDPEHIEQTIDHLRELRQHKLDERSTLEADLEELQEQKDRIESRRQQRQRIETRLADIADEIERREDRTVELRERRDQLSDQVADLEAAVDRLEGADDDTLADKRQRASELAAELESKTTRRDDIADELADLGRRLDRRDHLADQRRRVAEQLTDLRTRIDRLEADAVEQFNTHMETLLDLLDYDNIERIWIDRTETDDRATFELRVVRTTADGSVYEDSLDHLSESEREVTGLVFALAGYLVHDLHDSVPFMVLDSLEAIDATRIATLVEYFEEFVPYLVVALLEEDARALADDHDVISEL